MRWRARVSTALFRWKSWERNHWGYAHCPCWIEEGSSRQGTWPTPEHSYCHLFIIISLTTPIAGRLAAMHFMRTATLYDKTDNFFSFLVHALIILWRPLVQCAKMVQYLPHHRSKGPKHSHLTTTCANSGWTMYQFCNQCEHATYNYYSWQEIQRILYAAKVCYFLGLQRKLHSKWY